CAPAAPAGSGPQPSVCTTSRGQINPFSKTSAGHAGILLACCPGRRPTRQIGVSVKTAGFPIIGAIDVCCHIRPRARGQAAAGRTAGVPDKKKMEMIMSMVLSVPTAARAICETSWMGRLVATLKRWWTAYITWRIEQAAIAQLWSMSDRQLRDIGLTRSEIASAVRLGIGDRLFDRYH